MNDNRPNLSHIRNILVKSKQDTRRETRKYLAKEYRAMANFEGEYRSFQSVSTPLMQEIWHMTADYLEEECN